MLLVLISSIHHFIISCPLFFLFFLFSWWFLFPVSLFLLGFFCLVIVVVCLFGWFGLFFWHLHLSVIFSRYGSSFIFITAQSFHHPGHLCCFSLNSLQSLWWGGAQKQMSHSRWFHLGEETERLLLYLAVMWCDYLAFSGADLSLLVSLCVFGLDCGHHLWLL